MISLRSLVLALSLVGLGGACSSSTKYIYGTKVPDSKENRNILKTVEQYRIAVEKRDAPTLLGMAAPTYWEDGGTPNGSDDYGLDGLKEALANRFARASNIRYSMRYMAVKPAGRNRAAVDVLIDASYSVETGHGTQRLDMRDQNELVLEYDGRDWKFISGM